MKMDKKKIGIIAGVGAAIVIVALLIIFLPKGKDDKGGMVGGISDNLRFKEEYEKYNGEKTSDGKTYLEVKIDEDNPIVYKTDAEILDVLQKETAIVYFGWANCPWCRNIVEPLLQIAKDNGIDKIYYVDIYDIRDSYSVEKGKLKQDKKGTDAYYKILDFLGDKLDAYYVNDKDGKEYSTGVSRISAPTVVAVSNGEVKAYHAGTVSSQKDPYKALSEDEKNNLLAIYQNLYEPINKNICSSDGC